MRRVALGFGWVSELRQIFFVAFLFLNSWSGAETNPLLCSSRLAKKLRVAIVAGVSSGSAIPPFFKRLGLVEAVHVMPKEGLPHGYRLKPEDYIAQIDYSADLDAIARQLIELGVTVVLPGSEMGVELADALSEKMGLVTNGTTLSKARRNKFLMQEVIKRFKSQGYPNGIPGIRQREVKTIDDFKVWHLEENEAQWPVVLKPSESAATDGLFICEDYEQVEKALAASVGKKSFLGTVNETMLAQEYLKKGFHWVDGKWAVIPATEYVVDMISLNGKRIVTDVWQYHKTLARRPGGGLSNIYDIDELLDPDCGIAGDLIIYAEEVLNALGMQNGASHMEIMMTDRGPVLVEVGARLIGGASHLAVEEATGVNPIEILYEAYFEPEKFLKRQAETPRIKKRKHAWMIQLISHRTGRILGIPGLEELKSLPGVTRVDMSVEPNDNVKVTVDLLSSPGQVILAHDDLNTMNQSRKAIRELEVSGLFKYDSWWNRMWDRLNPVNWSAYWNGFFRR